MTPSIPTFIAHDLVEEAVRKVYQDVPESPEKGNKLGAI